MGPRLSTLHETGARNRQSPVMSSNTDCQQSAVHTESKLGYEGGRYAWTSASRRHVPLLDTIREKASRPRRTMSKPTMAVGGQLPHHGPAAVSSTADKRVWTKLIARLSRKMGATRLSSSRSATQQLPDNGVELTQGLGGAGGGLIRGTSTVLPVSRNPVTTTVAYNDNAKRHNNNNNISSDDIASRVGITTRDGSHITTHASHLPAASQSINTVAPKRTIQVQASSAELMVGLGAFLRRRCRRLRHFDGGEVLSWLRSVDRVLLEHAWQDAPFIGPANVVFVYLLARDAVDPDIVTAGELQAVIMACLYVAYSYAGCEISYPLKPFISAAGVDEATAAAGGPGKRRFWNRCMAIIDRSSGEMLRINKDSVYFAELFRELKSYAASAATVVQAASTAGKQHYSGLAA